MKKNLIYLLTSILFLSFSFAYTPTKTDTKLLESFYQKVDKLFEKDKSKVENLNEKIGSLKPKFQNNERLYYILSEIKNHIDGLTNTGNISDLQGPYNVIKVVDGDTIKIDYNGTGKNVRLIGVDTPEKYTTRYGYTQCFGDEASNYTKKNLEGKDIYLEFDDTQDKYDKYNRLLAYVFIDSKNWNLQLIQNGYGFEYTYKTAYKYQKEFKEAEKQAQETKMGLWATGVCSYDDNSHELSGFIYTGTSILNGNLDLTKNEEEIIGNYTCSAKITCSNINTCEEAKYHLNTCGMKSLDRDSDGIPCESLCK